MCDDESWECVWPPEVTSNKALVSRVIEVITETPHLHRAAWHVVSQVTGRGIDPNFTLLGELRDKSGLMSQPFIDEAVSRLFEDPDLIGSPQLGVEIASILGSDNPEPDDRSPSSSIDYDEEDIRDDALKDRRALELFKGCVWELAAMFCVHLISIRRTPDPLSRPTSSCYEPTDRAHFILASHGTLA